MTAALQQLTIVPDYLLIDAIQLDVLIEQKPLIKGDCRSVSIAAASILAKTHRDARMEEWDGVYPQYGLARHKGYATADHLEALRQHGPTPLHRYSFAPVRQAGCWSAGAISNRPLARRNLAVMLSHFAANPLSPRFRHPVPKSNGDNWLLTRNSGFVDLSFLRLLA